ncbi:MAG: addiction module protein [Bacteroidota bacterium]
MSNRTTKKLIEEIESLPVEERIRVADSALKSLNPIDQEIEDVWIETAERRLRELKSGNVTTIPSDEVFNKIKERFSK